MMRITNKMRIKTKIIVLYIIVLISSFFITFFVVLAINNSYTKKEIARSAAQTVDVLNGNLSLIFDNVTQLSNLVYFDYDVQNALGNVTQQNIQPDIQKTITKSLVNMILSGDYISSVFIIDKYENFYSSYKSAPKEVHNEKLAQARWYQEIDSHNGNGFFMYGSEGVLEMHGDLDYITYIRQICDEKTYKPLATLMVTVNSDTIRNYYEQISELNDSNFFIVENGNRFVVRPKEDEEQFQDYLNQNLLIDVKEQDVININDSKVLIVNHEMGIQDWQLIGVFPLENLAQLAPYYSSIIVIIMLINVMFVFICSLVLNHIVFKPLAKVENHMLLVDQGQFVEMEVDDGKNEINNLKTVFNHMTKSIKNLIHKAKEDEQVVTKSKLDLIQAQINPHFLYNTLDAVSALALLKDYDNCFKMTQALGSFYRNSLNSGLDFIAVEEEIKCIENYITILNIRYENKINLTYEVEDGLNQCRILKLLLQPLVENAVHHGIKANEKSGNIQIRIFSDDGEIIFMVTDDGIGMSEERIEDVMQGRSVTGKSGFGLQGLKQRISLYYGIKNPLIIHSESGNGTEVIVRIKRLQEGDYVARAESTNSR